MEELEIVPVYRLTKENIEDLFALHDSYPNKTIKDLMKIIEVEPDYSMYGT